MDNSKKQNEENLNAREAEVVQPQDNTPFKVFQTQAEWQNQIDDIIGSRLKEKRENESASEKYRKLSKLVTYYFDSDDVNVLQTIFSNMKRASMAQQLYQEAQTKSLKSDFDKRMQDIETSVNQYAEQNRDVNIEELSKSSEFLKYLWEMGLDAEDAYLLSKKGSIESDAVKKAKESIAAAILSKQQRIAENGVLENRTPKKRKVTPESLNNEDIDDILQRVKRGETITF